MNDPVALNDRVLLLSPDGERFVVRVEGATKRVDGLGVVRLADLVGRPWGDRIRLGSQDYTMLHPVLADHLRALERKAQIVLPKDAARILLETGLHAGSRVAEGGVGSGALTLVLAHAVAPAGRVYAYEKRDDHLRIGRANLERAGLSDIVEWNLGDIINDLKTRDLDAFILDIPDPENAIPAAHASLRPGGVLAIYTPLVGQAENAVRAARSHGFLDIRTLELLERSWVLHDRGARPDFNMLGHTGFLTFARRA